MKKQAGAVSKRVLKSMGKYELANATGGLSQKVAPSHLFAAKGLKDYAAYEAQAPLKERNKKPKMPEKEVQASAIRTHEEMLELEKMANEPSMLGAMGVGAGMALGTMGAVGAVRGASGLASKMKTERIWRRLKKEHPELTATAKDRENFEVLQDFSPDIASNISTARGYLERAKQIGGVPHEFVSTLSDIQSKRYNIGLGKRMEDVASNSGAMGVSFSKSLGKKAELLEIMDSVDPRT